MKEIVFDCLKKDYDENYRARGRERRVPEPREKDELFAFKWPDLPEYVQEAAAERIRQMYGLELPSEEVLRIFKCLVARDVEIPMPWIETEKGKTPKPKSFCVKTFNEKTFRTETKVVAEPPGKAQDAYYVHEYIGKTGNHEWLRDDEGYAMLQAWNSNLMTDDRAEARLYDREKAEDVCVEQAEKALLAYLGRPVRKGNAAFRALKRLDGRDWTKKGTAKLTKADFMERPRDFDNDYSYDHNVDWKLQDAIEKYKLPTTVNQSFIDWIASGCRTTSAGAKKSKLSAANCTIATAVDFPELTRANVVDCYHGLPGDILAKLQPGNAFTCGKSGTKYVVFRTAVVDNKKVIAYAKVGTTIDGEGFISRDDIRLGIDEESIEECWDCLFDVNRQGRRKKILKVRSMERAVKGNDGK